MKKFLRFSLLRIVNKIKIYMIGINFIFINVMTMMIQFLTLGELTPIYNLVQI